MRVMICLGQGGLRSLSASSYVCFRYTKLIVPAEHGSLFSTVNTKIMAWGIVLLLLVIYLGPIYGWGEYSQMKGRENSGDMFASV